MVSRHIGGDEFGAAVNLRGREWRRCSLSGDECSVMVHLVGEGGVELHLGVGAAPTQGDESCTNPTWETKVASLLT